MNTLYITSCCSTIIYSYSVLTNKRVDHYFVNQRLNWIRCSKCNRGFNSSIHIKLPDNQLELYKLLYEK